MRSYLDPTYDELGEEALAAAISDLYIRETAPNWGPEVAEKLKGVGISFPAAWCAAAVHSWIRKASEETGIESPIKPIATAKGTMMLLKEKDRWVDIARLRSDPSLLKPGAIVVWGRSGTWHGHIGIAEKMGDDGHSFLTIEGNMPIPDEPGTEGVGRIKRDLLSDYMLGAGTLSGPMPWEPSSRPSKLIGKAIPLGIGIAAGILGYRAIYKRI